MVRYGDEKEGALALRLHTTAANMCVTLPDVEALITNNGSVRRTNTEWRILICRHLFIDLSRQMRTYEARSLMRDWKHLAGISDDLFVHVQKKRTFHEDGERQRCGGFQDETAGVFTIITDDNQRLRQLLQGQIPCTIHYSETKEDEKQ